jgi:hypothetical protein
MKRKASKEPIPQQVIPWVSHTSSFIDEFSRKQLPGCLTPQRLRDTGDPIAELLDALSADGHNIENLRAYWRAKEDLAGYHRSMFSNINDMVWSAQHYPAVRVEVQS